jgi:hypothetical protein
LGVADGRTSVAARLSVRRQTEAFGAGRLSDGVAGRRPAGPG